MAPDDGIRRRSILAGATGAVASTSGCIGELRNIVGRERTGQLSLRISTVPAGDDPYAVRIANRLADDIERSGIATTVDLMAPDVLLREVLINHDFDIYVARYPSQGDPDELRSMLFSAYGEEPGWQNPFGFSDLGIDELLDEQRAAEGDERTETTREIQRRIVEQQPFTVVGFPERIGATRADRFAGWPESGPAKATEYLRLERVGEASTVEMLLRNDRITRNRNPIAAEYRDQGDPTGLLYEPLARSVGDDGRPLPWLARSITWDDTDPASATIRLRTTGWHDGEAVTASDVAFTYEFLADTSLGEFDSPAPTPWRRGRVSLVESVSAVSDAELRMTFGTGNRTVARRALSVPILPEHVWRERAGTADLAGIDLVGQTTEALVHSNEEPIGNGPLRFEDAVADESMSLTTFEDHFLYTGDTDGIPARFIGDRQLDRIEFTVVPSHEAAVEVLANGDADATADGLQASVVPTITQTPELSLGIRLDDPFYHVGYNCRRSPMTDPRFRQIVARHIDRAFIIEESLDGYGIPSEVPLKQQWRPEELRWDGGASLPFFGTNGDLDVESARAAFRDAGYQYEDEELIRRGQT